MRICPRCRINDEVPQLGLCSECYVTALTEREETAKEAANANKSHREIVVGKEEE